MSGQDGASLRRGFPGCPVAALPLWRPGSGLRTGEWGQGAAGGKGAVPLGGWASPEEQQGES